MGWIKTSPAFTVDELLAAGLPVDEACWIAWDRAPLPESLKRGEIMISIGEVHCHWCGDAFEPEGLPLFEGPNFCSADCEDQHEQERGDLEAYAAARYGAAAVYGE